MSSDYDRQLLTYLTGGMASLALALGKKLGLIEALCEVSSPSHHVTPDEVAEKAKCKPRYVREWLACLACANLFQVDDEERFWVTEEQKKSLLNCPWIANMGFIPLFADVRDKLEDAFRAENPRLGLDYSDYSKFYELMAGISEARHREFLIPNVVPDLGHGIGDRLVAGGMKCLDIGCGGGSHAYPKSEFIGLDLVEEAIKSANEHKEEEGTKNSSYVCCDATKLPDEWSNTFDFVTIFDACHDQTRPDLSIREIHRVLKPGGLLRQMDKRDDGLRCAMFYACSVFHCLPVGSNKEGALCLGTMWGWKE
ncbi:unnamed protein product, partial [Mesorhabditis belari]|uniref:Methyltransferase domain-containing protein n=1 Tax=Mesorhabditis belari TaxID=2138241 RepID=A0AAF3EFD7_9BILA